MKIKWLLTIYFSISILITASVLLVVLKILDADRELAHSEEVRYQSYLRADELRQSSDDLTRLARTYTVTGNPLYEDQYWQVLAIRNGEQARPEDYHKAYWDFMAAGNKPRADGQPIALQHMMQELGFTDAEFAKLKEAQENSDELVQLETIAMNAVKGQFDDGQGGFTLKGEPDLELARNLMHSRDYHRFKAQIMEPIDEFYDLLNERTLSAVTTNQEHVGFYFYLLLILVSLSLIVILAGAWLMKKRVLAPVKKLGLALQEVSENNATESTRLQIDGRDELSVVAEYFNKSADKFSLILQEMDAKSKTALRLQNALDSSSACLLVSDENETIIYVNEAANRTLEELENSIKQLSPSFSLKKLLGGKLQELFPQTTDLVHQSTPGEIPLMPCGESVIKLKANPITNDSGEHLGMMVEFKNVTEELAQQQQKQSAIDNELERAQTLNRDVDSLLNIVDCALQGDLTRSVTVKGDDIVGRMGIGIEKLLDELRELLSYIRSSADELNSSSETLTTASRHIGEIAKQASSETRSVEGTTNELNHSVDSIAAAVEQMSVSIKEISSNSTDASHIADNAVGIALNTDKTVRELSHSSRDIGDVLKVINSIAEQTNLLALNATIEAARAGEAGKGFSVVANEVKELAKETAKATDEVARRIETIQSDSENTVIAITSISETINQISEIQNTIASSIVEQGATTTEISRNMQNTANGSGKIARNIANVSKGVESTQEGVEQLRETAEEISTMADTLFRRVERFKLEKI